MGGIEEGINNCDEKKKLHCIRALLAPGNGWHLLGVSRKKGANTSSNTALLLGTFFFG